MSLKLCFVTYSVIGRSTGPRTKQLYLTSQEWDIIGNRRLVGSELFFLFNQRLQTDHSLALTFVLLISQAWCAQAGMRIHSYPSSCFWQCKTGWSYTMQYWFCWYISERIGSDREMIAACLHSFSHEVQKGRADSVIRVTQRRINMVRDRRVCLCRLRGHLPKPCFIIKSSNHRRCFYSSVKRAPMAGNHF